MAHATTKKTATLVTVDRKWQLTFTVVLIGSQLATFIALMWSNLHYSHYTNAGTWTFQVTQFIVFPLLFLAAGYAFTLRRVRGLVPRLFWATLVSVIGLAVYASLQIPLNSLFNALHLYNVSGDDSWWAAFGWIWIQMAAMLALYCLVLWLIFRKGRRR